MSACVILQKYYLLHNMIALRKYALIITCASPICVAIKCNNNRIMVASSYPASRIHHLLQSIKGLSKFVNKTIIRTTIRRLRERWGITALIVDMYGWLHAAKHKPGVVQLLSVGQSCPPLIEFVIRRIERINPGGIFKVIIYIFQHNSQ